MKSRQIIATVLLALAALPGLAWNAGGHGVIAQIAYTNLKPAVKAEVDRLLLVGVKEKWQNVIDAASWADAVRSKQNGPWHYIDWHFWEDGRKTTNKPDEENVVWALKTLAPKLADKSQSDAERADALRFIIHFVGDIHQPLHCVARDTDAHPDGDKGGNSFSIVTPPDLPDRIKNLHSMWDAGCGLFITSAKPGTPEARDEVTALATTLSQQYTPTKVIDMIKQRDFEAWSQEGLANAKQFVYKFPEGTAPSREYLDAGKTLSGKLGAVAGYRLADLLNRLLK